jgi:hypothetical protein
LLLLMLLLSMLLLFYYQKINRYRILSQMSWFFSSYSLHSSFLLSFKN